jgi:hypothetical protein
LRNLCFFLSYKMTDTEDLMQGARC